MDNIKDTTNINIAVKNTYKKDRLLSGLFYFQSQNLICTSEICTSTHQLLVSSCKISKMDGVTLPKNEIPAAPFFNAY